MPRTPWFYVYEDEPDEHGCHPRREVLWSEATVRDHELSIERLLAIRAEVDGYIAQHRAAMDASPQEPLPADTPRMTERPGVWITFQHAAYENCWDIRPHATERDALLHLAGQSYVDRVQFVPFGEVLNP